MGGRNSVPAEYNPHKKHLAVKGQEEYAWWTLDSIQRCADHAKREGLKVVNRRSFVEVLDELQETPGGIAWGIYTLAAAIKDVVANPGKASLKGHCFVMIGVGSEMGPFRTLMQMGATVVGTGTRNPNKWNKVFDTVRHTSGGHVYLYHLRWSRSVHRV